MKVYIACPWIHKDNAHIIAERVRDGGHEVVSRWVDSTMDSAVYEHPAWVMLQESLKNLQDLRAADVMLYLNLDKSEGKATEMGFMLAQGKPVYVMGGPAGNVFLHLPQITHVQTVAEFLKRVKAIPLPVPVHRGCGGRE